MALLSESDFRLIQQHIKRAADPHKLEAGVSRRVAIEKLPRTRMLILAAISIVGFSNWLLGNQANQYIGQTASAFVAQEAEAPEHAPATTVARTTKTTTTTKSVPVATPVPPAELNVGLPPYNTTANDPGPSSAQQYDNNGYSYGQCTWYVSHRRPIPNNWGNARDWVTNAKAAGWLTGPNPAVGAIAQTTSGPWGHVMYVEKVSGDQVYVSEMNYVGWNKVDYRWAPASSYTYIY